MNNPGLISGWNVVVDAAYRTLLAPLGMKHEGRLD